MTALMHNEKDRYPEEIDSLPNPCETCLQPGGASLRKSGLFFTTVALMVCVAGCKSEGQNTVTTAKTDETTEAPIVDVRTPIKNAPPLNTGNPSPASQAQVAVSDIPGSSQSATAARPDDVSTATEEIVRQPSRFPVEMARTVELRQKLQRVNLQEGYLDPNEVAEYANFSELINNLSQNDPKLSRQERENLMDYAGKLQFQSNQVIKGNVIPPFENRINSMKNSLKEIQDVLATR